MPISYNEQRKLFKLDTRTSTYAMAVAEGGYLVHLYYGERLPDDNLLHLKNRSWFGSLHPNAPDVSTDDFTLDLAPLELPCNGVGDFRGSALSVRNADGNTVTDLRYDSYTIVKGKPVLKGLPATFASEDDAETLIITMKDSVTGVKAELLYTVFANFGAMTRSVRVYNEGSAAVDLLRVYSACLDLPTMQYDMVHLYGEWARERTTTRHPLQHGLQSIRSKKGMSGPSHDPSLVLPATHTTEEHGACYGLNFVYSGNFAMDVEVDSRDCARVLVGINPEEFTWHLEPNESFTAPEVVMVYSHDGLGGMSREYHHFYLKHLCRSEWTNKKRPLLINSWEAAYFDFDGDKLVEFAKEAKELGIEMLVMDDGWFGNRFDDRRALGDWQVNEEKLGGTLKQLVDRVNALGVQFGIWYEPEMISPDSDLFRAHPDWAIGAPGRTRSLARTQYVLDMTRQDVRDYLFAEMSKVIGSANIAYIKWDCNRRISEAASLQLPAARQGEFFHRYVLGVYDLMNRITTAFPHILLENCSAGGGRFDAGMLYYSPQIWTSDNTDPIERLPIQFGTSLCYPVASMGAHVSANPRASLQTKANVAMCGTFGYELDPRKLTAEEKEQVKQQVADYHKYYDLIHFGDFYRVTSPTENRFWCDWEFVSPDKSEMLFTRVIMRRPENHFMPQCFVGLDPDRIYVDEATGERYSGALLMHAGLDLSPELSGSYTYPSDGDSLVKHFVAE